MRRASSTSRRSRRSPCRRRRQRSDPSRDRPRAQRRRRPCRRRRTGHAPILTLKAGRGPCESMVEGASASGVAGHDSWWGARRQTPRTRGFFPPTRGCAGTRAFPARLRAAPGLAPSAAFGGPPPPRRGGGFPGAPTRDPAVSMEQEVLVVDLLGMDFDEHDLVGTTAGVLDHGLEAAGANPLGNEQVVHGVDARSSWQAADLDAIDAVLEVEDRVLAPG